MNAEWYGVREGSPVEVQWAVRKVCMCVQHAHEVMKFFTMSQRQYI